LKKLFFYVITLVILINLIVIPVLAEEGEIITEIAIEGNEIISNDEILSVISTKVNDILNRDKIKEDMKKIYDMGYFQDVRVSFQNYQNGLKAIFEIMENPTIKEIIITGNEKIDKSILINLIGLELGEILNVNILNDGLQSIKEYYQNEGYILVKFTDFNITDGKLYLEINEGYLNEIILKGNEKTKDFIILRELDLKKGQVLNIKDVQKGFQNLYKMSYFKDIQPNLEPVEDNEENKNRVNLVVELSEDKTGNFNFGGGYSTKDGWYGYTTIKERNLLGNGQTLSFDWQFGEITNYSLNFYEPWLMGNKTSFGISLYDKTSQNNTDYINGDYIEKRQGGSISLGHYIANEWDGLVKLKIENSQTDWLDEEEEDEEGNTRSITLKAKKDTTNHPFSPSNGGIDTISIEYAGQVLGGDYNFTKYNLDMRRFYPGFKGNQAWALRLVTGIGNGDIPLLEEYRLGGSETLRGYERSTFSGDNMLLLNIEYRFPLAENFTGVIFADGGNAWDDLEDVDLEALHYSLGGGVRMNTPIGQIRLDYGFSEDGIGMPHFSIGNTF
jgi:outer membrane protein insertion porin family